MHAMPATSPAGEWMISVDDHLIEPPNVWTDRLPAKQRDLGPRWIAEGGVEAWHYEDVRQSVGGAVTSGAIWPPEDRPPVFNPLPFSEIPLACHDPKARIEAMDADRVLASLVFPNLPGFAGSLFVRAKDKDLALLCVQAYNDWVLDEWCAAAPGRFIPLALVPMWDSGLAGAEAERVIGKGARAISFSMAPQNLGLPPIDDPDGFWDPLFSTVSDAGVPLCTHLGTGSSGNKATADDRFAEMAKTMGADAAGAAVTALDMARDPRVGGTLLQLAGQTTLVEWIYSGNFDRYPKLRVALSENGIGWIPAVLQVADWMTEMSRNLVTQPADPENDPLVSPEARALARTSLETRSRRAQQERLPSEVFREHIYGCFIHDPVGLKLLDDLGVDNVMIETDFPHNSTWYPFSMPKAKESLTDVPDDAQWKILRGNAERVFSFTPAEVDV
jgi:predicted TIM-barrel fold metal-dependent hydrolase